MAKHVTFALFDNSGSPLVGATPVVAVYKNSVGTSLPAPTVTEKGGGFYEFSITQDESISYLIDAGTASSVRYLSGCLGGAFISFALYDLFGEPDPAGSPAFYWYADDSGDPLSEPVITNLGGGLYGFWPPVETGQIIRYVVGNAENRHWGTVGKTGIANEDPPAGTDISLTQAITFDVLDKESELGRVLIAVRYPAWDATELAWDGQTVCGPFLVTVLQIPDGVRYTVLRVGGWPSAPVIRVFLTNYGGREL